MSAIIYLEGGGDSREERARCREGFRKLLEKCGFIDRMPRLKACGGRETAFDDFKTAHEVKAKGDFVAMLIDSEDPIAEIEKTWEHLRKRKGDGWKKPRGASDDQILFMTTCMETWIVCDRTALQAHYGQGFQESALPALVDLETRHRRAILVALVKATSKCANAYRKGQRSFTVLAELDPATLEEHLPSFARALCILRTKL